MGQVGRYDDVMIKCDACLARFGHFTWDADLLHKEWMYSRIGNLFQLPATNSMLLSDQ